MRELDEWDSEYLQELAGPGCPETARLERKASSLFSSKGRPTRDEIAKQVSAFGNADGGFLVFGMTDAGGLDEGVEPVVGRQSVKDWVEAIVPKLVQPPIIGCEARLISHATHHRAGRGALVIRIPQSDRRPHWITDLTPQVAYLRLGAHSGPMSLLTFQDLCSRDCAPIGEIGDPVTWAFSLHPNGIYVNPRVGLITGPVAERWSLTLSAPPESAFFISEWAKNVIGEHTSQMVLTGHTPLFPGMSVHAATGHFLLRRTKLEPSEDTVELKFFVGSSQPIIRRVSIDELQALAEAQDNKQKAKEPIQTEIRAFEHLLRH